MKKSGMVPGVSACTTANAVNSAAARRPERGA